MKLIEIANDLKNVNQTLELINKELPDGADMSTQR